MMKDPTPGAYEFRIATRDDSFYRVAIVSTSSAGKTLGDGDVFWVGVTRADEATVTGTPRIGHRQGPGFPIHDDGFP